MNEESKPIFLPSAFVQNTTPLFNEFIKHDSLETVDEFVEHKVIERLKPKGSNMRGTDFVPIPHKIKYKGLSK